MDAGAPFFDFAKTKRLPDAWSYGDRPAGHSVSGYPKEANGLSGGTTPGWERGEQRTPRSKSLKDFLMLTPYEVRGEGEGESPNIQSLARLI